PFEEAQHAFVTEAAELLAVLAEQATQPARTRIADLIARQAAVAAETARLLANERLARELAERHYAEAEAASRARDDLLAVVSHDLRAPLSAISASAGMMKRVPAGNPAAERVVRAADTILRAVTRMDRLISDLLDVSLIEAKRIRVSPAPCD